MYIILALLIGLIIGLIRGGKISGIFNIPYNKWILGLVGVIFQIILHFYCYTGGIPALEQYLPIVNFISYLMILVMLIFNLDDLFTIMIAIGLTLNFVVTFINGGFLPVSENVVAVMPLYSSMTQSIYTGTNGVYALMQPTQTLLSFLGVTIPIPYFASIVVLTGTVAGVSLGDIFILIGLAGIVQLAMVTAKTRRQDKDENIELNDAYPIYPDTPRPHFESKTEELFFEDELLPENPLDKLFEKDSEYNERGNNLHQVSPLAQNAAVSTEYSQTEVFEELKDLTRPIGSGNTAEMNQTGTVSQNANSQKTKTAVFKENPPKEFEDKDGFFLSRYFSERQKNQSGDEIFDTLTTEELFQEETGIIPPRMGETSSVEAKEEHRVVIKESEIKNAQEHLDNQVQNKEQPQKEETASEGLKELLRELENHKYEGRPKPVQAGSTQTGELFENSEVQDIPESTVPLESLDSLLETEDTRPYEPGGIASFFRIPRKARGKKKKAQKTPKKPAEQENSALEQIQEKEEPAEVKQPVKEEVKPQAVLQQASKEQEELAAEPIEVEQEAITEEAVEDTQPKDIETVIDDKKLSRILASTSWDSEADKEEDTTEKTPDIEVEQFTEKTDRYNMLEDEKTGYIVSKAYKKEQAEMDKSEEEMMDIWSQISRENQERKLGRRRQASANYQTDNPYLEEQERVKAAQLAQQEAERRAQEAYERKQRSELNQHQDQAASAVNVHGNNSESMTDEERIAAGYHLVSFEVSGKKISFWTKNS